MTQETATAAQWAHKVAPAPDGHDYFDPNQPVDTLVVDLAKHHIARAYGFWQAVDALIDNPKFPQAMTSFIYEYQLASIWFRLACTDSHDPEQIAVDVLTDLASPQVLAGNVLELLAWANIDPAEIRPYMVEEAS
jgi:hypothetical protein